MEGEEGDGQEDEGLIWGGRGAFRWEDVEGVDIQWGVAALGPVVGAGSAGPASAGEQGLAKGKNAEKGGEGDDESQEEDEGKGVTEVKEWMYDL